MKHQQQQQQQQHLVYEATNSSDNNPTTNTKLLKERHIVTWTQQEDDILREQINTHGTENWAIIASKFKDKTTRQCRRRWYTYLNSDFKKGGWSPEEDMILCEAQKIFGNRWTEIAKVVSGRTDNAVKNRFSTLCKKRAKHETLTKENKTSCINSNDKRIIFQNGVVTDDKSESAAPLKKMRTHNTDAAENCNLKGRLLGDCGKMENEQLRHPFTVLIQNSPNVCELPAQQHISTATTSTSTASNDVGKHKDQGTFIKRDDPKIIALMKQAELLSSLALKVNTENNSQTLENAWKELQEFLNRTHERELLRCNVSVTEFPLEEFKDLVEELKCSAIGNQLYWRQPDLHEESPGSSEYSTGSTAQSNTVGENTEQPQAEVCSLPQGIEPQSVHILVENSCGGEDGLTSTSVIDVGLPIIPMEGKNGGDCGCPDGLAGVMDVGLPIIPMEGKNGGDCGCADGLAGVIDVGPPLIHMEAKNEDDVVFSDGFHIICTTAEQVVILPSSDEPKGNGVPALSNRTFSSPIQVTPVFQTFASTIPSPKFSESERNFLMKTLGSTALSPNPSINFSQPPPCKRALLHSL